MSKTDDKLIADFMGLVYKNSGHIQRMNQDGTPYVPAKLVTSEWHLWHPETNWVHLMRVVEKIESTILVMPEEKLGSDEYFDVPWEFVVIIKGYQCTINKEHGAVGFYEDILETYDCRNNNKLTSTYKTVVKFIKWYNEN